MKVSSRVSRTGTGKCSFFGGIQTGIGTNWYRKKNSEPVSEKSIGTGTEKIDHLLRKG